MIYRNKIKLPDEFSIFLKKEIPTLSREEAYKILINFTNYIHDKEDEDISEIYINKLIKLREEFVSRLPDLLYEIW